MKRMQPQIVKTGLMILLLLLSFTAVNAAKTYTIAGSYDTPTIDNIELITGGTLDANETYYYRMMTWNSYYAGGNYVSPLSNTVSITTDDTHKSVLLNFTHSTGNKEYTAIWVSKNIDPGFGQWSSPLSTNVTMLGSVSTSILATGGSTKIDSYTDTGTRSSAMSIGSSNYGMMLPYEYGRDYITPAGGTLADPITLEDIYQYALANGWNLNKTIKRLDYGTTGAGDALDLGSLSGYGNARPTYVINAQRIYYDDYFKMYDQNIIAFCKYFGGSSTSHTQIGEYDESIDLTKNGIDFTVFGHGSMAGDLSFYNAGIYDSKFRFRRMAASGANAYSSNFRSSTIAGEESQIVDVSVASEYDRGLSLSWGDGTNLLKRVRHYENRWETNTYDNPVGIISDWKFNIANSGPWIRTRAASPIEGTIRNIQLIPGSRTMYLTPDYGTTTYATFLTLLNPILEESAWDKLYWYVYGTLNNDNAHLTRAYTFTVNVVDNLGDALEGANVTLTQANGTVVFSELTNVNGTTGEEIVTHTIYKCNETLGTAHYQPDARTLYQGPWDLSITYPGYMPIQLNGLVINKETEYTYSLGPIETILLQEGGSIVELT